MMRRRIGTRALLALAVWTLALQVSSVRSASAQIDLNGQWVVQVLIPVFPTLNDVCSLAFVQMGTGLSISGPCQGFANPVSLAGSIDTGTGVFTVSGSAGVCSALSATGTASDNNNFAGTFTCTSIGIGGGLVGSRCGNGIVDPGEACDDGNQLNGDCCSSTCQLDSAGQPCTPDPSVCTDDVCDGAGVCTHPFNTDPCDDGFDCTVGDTCSGGTCISGSNAAAGTPCNDDDDLCTIDSCDANGVCQPGPPLTCAPCFTCFASAGCFPSFDPCDDSNACTHDDNCDENGACLGIPETDGTACSDGDACTSNDTCQSGSCSPGPATVCDPCLSCDTVAGCIPELATGCKQSAKNKIQLKDAATDTLLWKWQVGEETFGLDFGNPAASTQYQFCIYDGPSGNPNLFLGAAVPAGPNWSPQRNGFIYKSSALTPDGVSIVKLKAGAAGKSHVLVKGKGANLNLAPLTSITLPVTVQLKKTGAAPMCWEASYATPSVSGALFFKAANQ